MELNAYQQAAQKTDRVTDRQSDIARIDVIVPLLGLAGEAGELLSEYKKHLRDGVAHLLFKDRVSEELGDLLWYIANVAEKFDLKLDDVAQSNLRKTYDRWGALPSERFYFDSDFPEDQRLPLKFEVELTEVEVGDGTKIRATVDGKQIGDDLTDNADDPDGYRFHDIFHLAYVAVLGWSPVIRKLLRRKRKNDQKIDEIQDGGRAQVIDEAVSALAFDYAKSHNDLEGVAAVDYHLLRTIKGITSLLEVKERTMAEWQHAILMGFEVWRAVWKNGGGRVLVDQHLKKLTYLGPPNSAAQELAVP